MTDIMELIEKYAALRVINTTRFKRQSLEILADENLSQIKSRISAMQEVCDKAIKCKGLGMEPELYDAVTKLEELK